MVNILQKPIFTDFLYPFLLMFFLVFAVLQKTKLLGDNKSKQLDAFISLIISLIFVGAVFPMIMVENLILFLTVALVVLFVGMLLWGFMTGKSGVIENKGMKIFLGTLLFISLILVLIWAVGLEGIFEKAFNHRSLQNLSCFLIRLYLC